MAEQRTGRTATEDERPISPVTPPDSTEAEPGAAPALSPQEQAQAAAIGAYYADIEAHRVVGPSPRQTLGQVAPAAEGGPHLAGAGPMPPAPVVAPEDVPAPRVYYSAAGGSGTLAMPRSNILASTKRNVIRPVTVDKTTLTADANGDKILVEGTIMAKVPSSNPVKYRVRTGTQAAVGICMARYNLRDADADIAMLVGGDAWWPACIDDGVLGGPGAAGTPEADLKALGLYMHAYQP